MGSSWYWNRKRHKYLEWTDQKQRVKVAYSIRYSEFLDDQYIPNKKIIPSTRELLSIQEFFSPNYGKFKVSCPTAFYAWPSICKIRTMYVLKVSEGRRSYQMGKQFYKVFDRRIIMCQPCFVSPFTCTRMQRKNAYNVWVTLNVNSWTGFQI